MTFPEYIVFCEQTRGAYTVYRDLGEAVTAAKKLSQEYGCRYAVYVLASVEMP